MKETLSNVKFAYNYIKDQKIRILGLIVTSIFNVISFLNSSIENKGKLKQIGVQGPAGLLMCINGESIYIGRTGIYEINYGISISSIGFVVEPDDNKNFIMDYQY